MAVFAAKRMKFRRHEHAAHVKITSLKHHNRAEDSHVSSSMPALRSKEVVDIQNGARHGCHELKL